MKDLDSRLQARTGPMNAIACARPPQQEDSAAASLWPLERVLFALAGTMTLLSAALAALVSPWFLLLTAFVGINQWLYVAVGACPASLVLRRLFSLRSVVYPRRRRAHEHGHPSPSRDGRRLPRARSPSARSAASAATPRPTSAPCSSAWLRGRARARLLRPESRDGALRRRLGSERLAVGAGAQAGRTRTSPASAATG